MSTSSLLFETATFTEGSLEKWIKKRREQLARLKTCSKRKFPARVGKRHRRRKEYLNFRRSR